MDFENMNAVQRRLHNAAHAFLVARAERDVETMRMHLEQAKGKLGQIRGMKPSNAGG